MLIRCILFSCLLSAASSATPSINGADPHAVRVGKTYWMYPTEAGAPEPLFAAYRSDDLKDWKREATVLKLADVSWVDVEGPPARRAWAPSMLEKDGRFYFYYSVGPQMAGHPSRIGVATGNSPAGPFHDSGKPLLTGGNGFEAIDPMAFTDPSTGKTYLYAGGSAGSKLRTFELNDNLVTFRREIETTTPPQFTEAPFVHFRNGVYYLSYSHGRWNKDEYSVYYATSDSPEGPWKYRGPILQRDKNHQGPGHHSFVESQDGEWFIVYHRWETTERPGPYKGHRKIAIDKVRYDDKGLILPIVMADPASPPK